METEQNELVTLALTKFGYQEVSHEQLARHIGFSEDEIKMLKILWDPVFNKSWVILNRDIVKQWFCKDDKSKYAVAHFYERVLFKYDEDIDYKPISINQLVDTDRLPNLATKKQGVRGGHNAKYYKVTGECLKMIAMERNKDIRRYYLKVEELAMFMREYIHVLHKHISTKQLDDMTTKVNNLKIINDRVQNFIDNTKALEKKSTFYIATSKRYAEQNIFKPGCIDTIGKKSLTARLAQYNTGKTGDDLFYFCYVEEVYDSKELDHKLKKLFVNMKMNKRKEMVICHWDDFIDIVKYVSTNHTEDYNYFNEFITSGKFQLTFKKAPVIPPPIQFGHTITIKEHKNGGEIKTQMIDVANLTDVQKKEYLIRAIEIFCTTNGTPYDHETEKDNADKKITLVWKDIQSILKNICQVKKLGALTKWKNPLKNIETDSQSIQQIKWVKK